MAAKNVEQWCNKMLIIDDDRRALFRGCWAAAIKSVEAQNTAHNLTKIKICGKIIESKSICSYCKVGYTVDCAICINKSYGNFIGRKLAVIC